MQTDKSSKSSFIYQIVSILVAICIFIAGYLLSEYGQARERKRTIQNIKSILFKEMAHNYKQLNLIIPKEAEFNLGMIELPITVAETFSFEIYEKYLDRLGELKSEEVDKIFNAYLQLKGFSDNAKEYMALNENEPKAVHDLRRHVLLVNMNSSYKQLEVALRVFEEGEPFIKGEISNRGKEYYRLLNLAKKAVKELKLKQSNTSATSDH